MPRPPIHNTADAKAKAAREKHKRYYAKHRDSILKRRRELRSSKSKAEGEKMTKEILKAVAKALHDCDEDEPELDDNNSDDSDENDKLPNLAECLFALKGIKDDMLSLIGSDPCTYVEGIFQEYVKSMADDDETNGDISIIDKSMAKVEKILNHAIPVQDEILNFCGLSTEWHAADSVTRFLRTVMAYLEDIQCLVLLGGVSELANAHRLGELMYQKGVRI